MDFDPFSPAVMDDPYPVYRALRSGGRLHHAGRLGFFVVHRHRDVAAAARDHRRLSSAEGVTYLRFPLPMMLSMDPPEHERLRRLVSRDFTPKAVRQWEPMIRDLVSEHVDRLVAAGTADAVRDLAAPLPVAVIANILGVPPSDWKDFKRWSDDMVAGFNLAGGTASEEKVLGVVVGAIGSLRRYFDSILPQRRDRPGDDLVSKLLVPLDGDVLSTEELFWFFLLLLVAGNETTTSLIGNMLLGFCEHPDQWELVRSGAAAPPRVVDEALRYDPPIQGFFRTAVDDAPVGDEVIPAGSRVLLSYGAANRDPDVFDDPDRFDVTRDASEHLAFSSGIHFCLGANLARMEVELVVSELAARVSRFEAVGEHVRALNPTTRGLASLPLRFIGG